MRRSAAGVSSSYIARATKSKASDWANGEASGGLDRDERDLARRQPREQLAQRRQVEVVLQELAVGLEHDRERSVALGDLQQRLRTQALLPEWRALAGPPARDQERACGVLAGSARRTTRSRRAAPTTMSSTVSGSSATSSASGSDSVSGGG